MCQPHLMDQAHFWDTTRHFSVHCDQLIMLFSCHNIYAEKAGVLLLGASPQGIPSFLLHSCILAIGVSIQNIAFPHSMEFLRNYPGVLWHSLLCLSEGLFVCVCGFISVSFDLALSHDAFFFCHFRCHVVVILVQSCPAFNLIICYDSRHSHL